MKASNFNTESRPSSIAIEWGKLNTYDVSMGETDICTWTRAFISGSLKLVLAVAVLLSAAGVVLWSVGDAIAFWVSGILNGWVTPTEWAFGATLVIVATPIVLGAAWVNDWVVLFRRRRDEQRDLYDDEWATTPTIGVIGQAWRSFHDKTCFKVNLVTPTERED